MQCHLATGPSHWHHWGVWSHPRCHQTLWLKVVMGFVVSIVVGDWYLKKNWISGIIIDRCHYKILNSIIRTQTFSLIKIPSSYLIVLQISGMHHHTSAVEINNRRPWNAFTGVINDANSNTVFRWPPIDGAHVPPLTHMSSNSSPDRTSILAWKGPYNRWCAPPPLCYFQKHL